MSIALIISLGGGGAERQVVELYEQGIFEKVIMLENDCEYDIPEDALVRISNLNKTRYHRLISFQNNY